MGRFGLKTWRPLELALLLASCALQALTAENGQRRTMPLAVATLGVMVAQITIEGPRWQLYLLYAATGTREILPYCESIACTPPRRSSATPGEAALERVATRRLLRGAVSPEAPCCSSLHWCSRNVVRLRAAGPRRSAYGLFPVPLVLHPHRAHQRAVPVVRAAGAHGAAQVRTESRAHCSHNAGVVTPRRGQRWSPQLLPAPRPLWQGGADDVRAARHLARAVGRRLQGGEIEEVAR